MEKQIISAILKDRKAFDIFSSRGVYKDLSPPGQIIFELSSEYYDNDLKVSCIDTNVLLKLIENRYSKYYDQLKPVLENKEDISIKNTVDIWLEFKRKAISNRLSSALLGGDNKEIEKLIDEYNFYKVYVDEQEKTFENTHPIDLLNEEMRNGLIPIYPKCVNDNIGGGADPGSHIVVFGRPDSGKTQFVINAASVLVKKGYKVLYGGNEDSARRILLRFIARLSDMTIDEIKQNPEKAYDLAYKNGYKNIVYEELLPGTIGEIRSLIEKHKPNIVIIDQIGNMDVGSSNKIEILDLSVKGLRTLYKEFGVVGISVTQAGESAHHKAQLDYNDVEYSNTGVAAQADLMVGIGVNPDLFAKNMVVLSLCKNKFTDSYPALPVYVDRTKSKLRSEM